MAKATTKRPVVTAQPATRNGVKGPMDLVSTTTRVPVGVVQPDSDMMIGEGHVKYTESTVKLSKLYAEHHLQVESLPYERPLRNNHVEYLISCMKRGTFRPELCNLATAKVNGVTYRVNGQHTAWARVLYDDSRFAPPVRLLEYRLDDDVALRDLYSSIDRAAPRTSNNIITARLYGTETFEGISSATLRRLSEGFALWRWEKMEARKRHDADERAVLMAGEYKALVLLVGGFCQESQSREYSHVHRGPAMAGMLATFEKNAKKAIEFWTSVRDGTGFTDKDDPILTLRNALLTHAVSHGRGNITGKKAVTGEEMFRWCILCWNAFRRGETLRILRPNMSGDRPAIRS